MRLWVQTQNDKRLPKLSDQLPKAPDAVVKESQQSRTQLTSMFFALSEYYGLPTRKSKKKSQVH